ncbi:ABC transporter substrate-binding protein [Xylophilus sp. ASV27]|uniref:ABC transporter substrate-binding protein n=1 Tax=Xylophilus sp. ASV27 TaxID=2795129 RepID=UPI0018ECA9C6|nr:ABC transporter substrate-binding protein [Xylophilus sp. ASV27]
MPLRHSFNRRHCLLFCAALTLGSAHAAGVSDKEILLGTHLDLSGPTATGSVMLRNAMQMRLDEANATGIHGRQIRLVTEDNGSQPQMAVRAVQKMIRSDKVFAIVNPFGSGTNAATVKMATDAGVIVFAPWAASSVIQKVSGNSPLLFTTVQNYDSTTATGLGWAIRNWDGKRVGLIYQEGPFGDLIRAGVHTAMQQAGLTLAAEAAYKVGDIDFSSQVARMKAANVDLIFAGTVIRETVGVMAEVRKLNWTSVKVLTGLPGRSSVVAALGKDTVEGLYGIGGWKLHDPNTTTDPAAREFFTGYKARFGHDADENAANAYSYMSWFLDGIQATGADLTAERFSKAMQGVPHEDFTTYTRQAWKNNHAMPELVSIDQIKGGRWVQLSKPTDGK